MPRRIKIDWAGLAIDYLLETPFPAPERTLQEPVDPTHTGFDRFLDDIGLVGMGGSGFPTSQKIRNAVGAHTLVINGVECEPGATIDQSLLLHHEKWVTAGVSASARAIGAENIVLAIKNDPKHLGKLQSLYPDYRIVHFPDRYPSGAEKLIVKRLSGKMPPPGIRPYRLGYLIQNVASLRAIGRAILDGIAVVERPLTLAMPTAGFYKNIVAPVGLPIRNLLDRYDLPYDAEQHFITDSGLMMGSTVSPDDCIKKTTLSLFVLERAAIDVQERPCIRCGACNTTCPLNLHPFTLVERIRKGQTGSTAFKAQMTECFLCGVCSAACPSDIPLVQALREGKQCL